ncbi:3447_t:CDS:2, partial [Rhizophagus irregularis]
QLILPSGHTMSWACYRFIAGLSAKGRIAKWFQLLTRWIKKISAPEMSKHSLFNFLSNILQPVSKHKRKHPYVIIKDKNNEVSIGFVKKRTHIKKNGEKIECLNIEVCNIEIYLDNPQKAIIQKQEHPKMITINQHNALVLPIFIRFSTGSTTHIDWYYIVESLNRAKNISENIDIQQLEKTPTINLNGDNLGLWINRWIEQDTLKQELTDIRHQLKAEIVAIFLALLTAPENSNVTIYTDSLVDNPIEVNIRRFILKILATGEATE